MKNTASVIGLLSTILIMSSVSVELGYFLVLGIEFFSALSISDHVAVVIRFLPFVLPLWAISAIIGYGGAQAALKEEEATGKIISSRDQFVMIAFLVVVFIVALNWYAALFLTAFFGWILFGLRFLRFFLPDLEISSGAAALIHYLPAAFFFLVGIGATEAGAKLHVFSADWTIHKTDGSIVQTEILNVFQQGVLVWDGDRVTFHKIDSIAQIDGDQHRFPLPTTLDIMRDFFVSPEEETEKSE